MYARSWFGSSFFFFFRLLSFFPNNRLEKRKIFQFAFYNRNHTFFGIAFVYCQHLHVCTKVSVCVCVFINANTMFTANSIQYSNLNIFFMNHFPIYCFQHIKRRSMTQSNKKDESIEFMKTSEDTRYR